VILLLLALGCAHKAPVLFPEALPEVAPPETTTFEPVGDDCPKMAVKPGQPFPHIDIDGNATCRAQLVPELRVYQLLDAQAHATYWSGVSSACYDARAADRRYAQTNYGVCWQQKREAQKDAQVQRIVAGAAVVGGTVVGLAIGATYAKIGF
jgi:hypothetical protein